MPHQAPAIFWTWPFIVLLLAIAILPLIPRIHDWWHRNPNKLLTSVVLGAVVLGYYGLRGYGFHGAPPGWASVRVLLERAILEDYLPFIVLLFCLYVVAGGLQLTGDLRAFPRTNTAFLALGAASASLIGTTGASLLLIRPLLQTNQERKHVTHTVVFFIFLVSNIGGCLLPLGDPPLFLGYLRGVPFTWTLSLFSPWLCSVLTILLVYYLWDRHAYRRESPIDLLADMQRRVPMRLRGSINALWLGGIVFAVALIVPGRPFPGTAVRTGPLLREAILLALAALSLATTPRGLRREAGFRYGPIVEVACLFLGIFLTMQIPLEILRAQGPALGLATPAHFFWATGALSGFLDNAPTYAVFLETARSLPAQGASLVALLEPPPIRADLLTAISLGAVFMGANTYVGNAPNFMVKAIAEHQGVPMPKFFGYMLYSMIVLVPLYVALSVFFLRRF